MSANSRTKEWAREIEIECAEPEALQQLEEELADDPGISLREPNVHSPGLRSELIHTIIIGVSSAGFASATSAVLINFIKSRRVKITVRQTKAGNTVTYEGPVRDGRKVLEIVNPSQTPELQE
ncbi:hypothetical protein ABZZ20_29185 [Streptomyces sp. NPDC006430]|uniref:effector-associated constant component EACC1 n=1 Tax=Streptomyces sp. NPDC006430 TaxID=3154299 RepID=UPI0033B5641C